MRRCGLQQVAQLPDGLTGLGEWRSVLTLSCEARAKSPIVTCVLIGAVSTLPLPEGQVDMLPLTLQWVDTATFSVRHPAATQTTTRRLR